MKRVLSLARLVWLVKRVVHMGWRFERVWCVTYGYARYIHERQTYYHYLRWKAFLRRHFGVSRFGVKRGVFGAAGLDCEN